jgi:hypothetical protein
VILTEIAMKAMRESLHPIRIPIPILHPTAILVILASMPIPQVLPLNMTQNTTLIIPKRQKVMFYPKGMDIHINLPLEISLSTPVKANEVEV